MRRFNDLTIREKLTTLMMALCMIAICFTSIALAAYFGITYSQTMIDDIQVDAAITAENCNYGLAFGVVEDVDGVLKSLHAKPSVVFAGVFDKEGKIFARYVKNSNDRTQVQMERIRDDGWYLDGGLLTAYHSIVLDEEKIGTLCIRSNLSLFLSMLYRMALCLLVVLVCAYFLTSRISKKLQRVISQPIIDLTDVAQQVTCDNDYSVRAVKSSTDEVGVLIDSFNRMLDQIKERDEKLVETNETLADEVKEKEAAQQQIKETHQELLAASRRAGMAEVATDVLHNVGNVLNSLNLTSELINETLSNSKLGNLSSVSKMLKEHEGDLANFLTRDPKGQRIPSYMSKVIDLLVQEQMELSSKATTLTEKTNHIKDIIRTQQSYAKVAGVETETTLEDVINSALAIGTDSFKRHQLEITQDLEPMGLLRIDQQRLLQILVNLISNAKQATKASDLENKRIEIISSRCAEDRLRIEVRDNGIGIPKENMTKIFQHGFTTRDKGHGFGLHGSALAAQELGGSLIAESEGPGKGASFILEIPLNLVEASYVHR